MSRKRTVAATLKKARKLITPKYRWIQNNWVQARKHRGRDVECYCLEGALCKAAFNDPVSYGDTDEDREFCEKCILTISSVIRSNSIFAYNDSPRRTHEQVLAALDRAIAKAEKKGI